MSRYWLAGCFLVLLITSLLMADQGKPGVVTNRQGDKFTGDVWDDGTFVHINGPGGEIKLDKRNVSSITYAANVEDDYNARHAKLTATDVKGRIDLAAWAIQNNRVDLAIKALNEARTIDPMNKDAARAWDAAMAQQEMEAKAKQTAGATSAPVAATGPASTQAVAAAPEVPLERRLLNNDEINIIRQKEMQADDPKIKIRFDNNVVKKYLASGDHDAAAFAKLPPVQQAIEILSHGDPKMARDVKVLTDPAPLVEFRQKVAPIIATGCASTACHGGTKAGDFSLYQGDSNNAVYTNFYILFSYSKTIDGVKYLAMDRDVPEHSLVLQLGLPRVDGKPPHPAAASWRPRFKTVSDPGYTEIYNFLSKSLSVMQPDYGIKVAARLPTSQAAAPPPAATQSAVPGK